MLISGFFNFKITSIDLQELKDFTFERSFGGLIFGYGAFTIESGGRKHTLIDYIPFSEQVYLETRALIWPFDVDTEWPMRGPDNDD